MDRELTLWGNWRRKSFYEKVGDNELDLLWSSLLERHPLEMQIVFSVYVMKWNIKKTSKELGKSRYEVKKILSRAKVLIEGAASRT